MISVYFDAIAIPFENFFCSHTILPYLKYFKILLLCSANYRDNYKINKYLQITIITQYIFTKRFKHTKCFHKTHLLHKIISQNAIITPDVSHLYIFYIFFLIDIFTVDGRGSSTSTIATSPSLFNVCCNFPRISFELFLMCVRARWYSAVNPASFKVTSCIHEDT
jgi:hypothetical protein